MHLASRSRAVLQRPLTLKLREGYKQKESGSPLFWMETQKTQSGPGVPETREPHPVNNDPGSSPRGLS